MKANTAYQIKRLTWTDVSWEKKCPSSLKREWLKLCREIHPSVFTVNFITLVFSTKPYNQWKQSSLFTFVGTRIYMLLGYKELFNVICDSWVCRWKLVLFLSPSRNLHLIRVTAAAAAAGAAGGLQQGQEKTNKTVHPLMTAYHSSLFMT